MSNYKIRNTDGFVIDTNGRGVGIPTVDDISNAPTSGIVVGTIIYAVSQKRIYSFDGTVWLVSSGTSGTAGSSGSAGTAGTSGSAGSSGSTGTSGSSGSTGTSGSAGSSGRDGTAGSSGSAGSAGSSGSTGTSGSSGSTGSSGSAGSSGSTGSSGTAGTSGISLNWRSTYSSGTTYNINDVVYLNGTSYVSIINNNIGNNPASSPSQWAIIALAGTSGSSGSSGSTGSSGSSGINGTAGSSGSSGSTGSSGSSGSTGSSGSSGTSGTRGSSGSSGSTGSSGSSGSTGSSGSSGQTGSPGSAGSSGSSGSSGAGTISGTTNYVSKFTSSTVIGNSLIFDNGTSVGINTASPSLHSSTGGLVVRGTARGIIELWDATSGKSVFQNVGGDTYIGQLDKGTGAGTTYVLVNGNGSTADIAMTLLSNSNVGVGTQSPGVRFEVSHATSSDDAVLRVTGTGALGAGLHLNATGTGGRNWRIISTGASSTPGAGELGFYDSTAGLYRMVIDPGGNVGIGTVTPDAIFHVARSVSGGVGGQLVIDNPAGSALGNTAEISFLTDAGASGAGTRNARILAVNENVGNGAARMEFHTWDGGTSAARMIITSGGLVGIGTATANRQLTFVSRNEDAIQIRRLTTSEGNVSVGTGISWTWTSSGTDNETWAAIRVIMPGNGNSNMTFSTTPAGGGGSGLTERLRIADNGNIGINNLSPNSRMDILVNTRSGSHASSQALYVTADMGTGQIGTVTGNIEFRHSNASQGVGFGYNSIYQTGTNTNEVLNLLSRGSGALTLNSYAYSTGNVGVNNATPTYKFDVVGDMRSTTSAYFATSSGSVGIGTVSPNAKLDVVGGITLRAERVSTSQEYPVGHYTTGETVFEIDPTWTQAQLQDYFGSTGVTWNSDTTAPSGYCIQIDGAVNVGGVYNSGFPYIPVDSGSGDWYYMECWIRNEAGSSIGHYMGGIDFNASFTSLGGNPGSFTYNVMLNYNPGTSWTKVTGYWNGFGSGWQSSGTGNTNQWVSGTKYFTPQALFNYSQYGGTIRCYISGWKCIRVSNPGNRYFSNNIYASGDVVAYHSSDERLKNDILRIQSPLEKISRINGVTFSWNENQQTYPVGKKDIGVIAQEVEEVLPEIVETRESGYKAIKYEKIVPLLIESIKEQQSQINDLKNQIKSLTGNR